MEMVIVEKNVNGRKFVLVGFDDVSDLEKAMLISCAEKYEVNKEMVLVCEKKKDRMKLYLLTRTDEFSFVGITSCVVCSESESDALTINPHDTNRSWNTWVDDISYIECKEIGEANENQNRGVILVSFSEW